MKPIFFLILWTATAALFTWVGYNRLSEARTTGKFQYLWHGVGQDNWPVLFGMMKAFLTVWTGVAGLMTAIGLIWIVVELVKAVR